MSLSKLTFEHFTTLRRLLRLKGVLRAGWTRHDIPFEQVESVADHSYGVALLCVALCPPELDRAKVLELAILHDLAEVEVGDITPHDGVSTEEKKQRETLAASKLLAGLPEAEPLLERFEDMLSGKSPEARWVKAIDKLEMSLQSLNYENDHGIDLKEFRESSAEALSTLGIELS